MSGLTLHQVDKLAHRMKVTLTYLRGFASMLPLDGNLNESQERYIQKILKGVDDLAALIDELESSMILPSDSSKDS